MNESCWVLLSVSKNPNSPNMPVCRRVPLTGKEAYLAELLGLDEPPDEAADGAEPAAVEAAAAAAGAEGERRPDFRKTEYAVMSISMCCRQFAQRLVMVIAEWSDPCERIARLRRVERLAGGKGARWDC